MQYVMKNIKLTASSAKERYAAEQEVRLLNISYQSCIRCTPPGLPPVKTKAPKHRVLQGVLSRHPVCVTYCHGLL